MNRKIRQDVVEIIESRFRQADSSFSDILRGELLMAIDLAGLTGAIDIDKQHRYSQRLVRLIERDHQQLLDAIRRVA